MANYKTSWSKSWYDFEEDYYSRKKSKKYNNWYSFNNSEWNYWGNNKKENEDINLCIIEPDGYITPSNFDIVGKKILCGKKEYIGSRNNYSYAWSSTDIEKESSIFIKNMSRYFYHSLLENEDYFVNSIKNEDKDKYEKIIDRVKDIKLPYSTPLEKAVFIHNKIYKEKKNKDNSIDDILSPKKLMTVLEQLNLNTDAYNDKELDNTLNKILMPGGLLGGTGYDSNKNNEGYEINRNALSKINLIDKISLIKSWGDSFKISKEIKKEAVYNSDKKEYMNMTSIEQIVNMDLYQILFPNFKYKLATNNLHINVPVKKEEKKQKIIMMIDDSGSMHVKEKIEWVLALLIDRLNECKKEEAELFVTKFEYSPNENKFRFYHVYNEESFENFIKIFKYNPRGGDTNIGRHIDYIADEINIHKKLHNLNIDLSKEKVEILILNDGQDVY